MENTSKLSNGFHILRVGIAITFLWIGILILKEPTSWGGFIQPWAMKLLPFSLKEAMIGAAIFDIIIGFLLLIDYKTWIAAFLGSLHLVVVLMVSGINAITIRDIGLLAGALGIFTDSAPAISVLKKSISRILKAKSLK